MPKKKKTRKQKILAEMRHKAAAVSEPKAESKPQPQFERPSQPTTRAIATSSYQYLYSDLLKTVILTFSIIAGELLLRYLFF